MSTNTNNNSVGSKKASKLLDSEETVYANQVELIAVKEKGEQRCPVVPEAEDEAMYANVTEVAKKEGQRQSKGQMRGQRTSQGERRKKKSGCSNPTDSTGDPRKVLKKKSPSIPKEADPGTIAKKSNLPGKVKVEVADTKPPVEEEELYLNTQASPADEEELYTNEMQANVGRDQVAEAALTPEPTDDDIYYNSESFPAAQTSQTESPAEDPEVDEETYENTDGIRMNVSALKKLWSTKQWTKLFKKIELHDHQEGLVLGARNVLQGWTVATYLNSQEHPVIGEWCFSFFCTNSAGDCTSGTWATRLHNIVLHKGPAVLHDNPVCYSCRKL